MTEEKTVNFEMPTELYNKVMPLCEKLGWTIEEFIAEAIIKGMEEKDPELGRRARERFGHLVKDIDLRKVAGGPTA